MTTIRPFTDPGVIFPLGGQWTIVVETRNDAGNLSGSVTPSLSVTLPDGATVAATFAPWSVAYGFWLATYTAAATGRYVAHASTPEDAVDFAAYVVGPTTESGMPTVDDVAKYLGASAASWSTADLQDELGAETEAQQDRCGVRANYPLALRKALLRRVQRALAMRALPLATLQGDADGGALILPGNDPEVRRLENPHRKLAGG